MTLHKTNGEKRSFRHRGASVLAVTALAVGLALVSPLSAAAATFGISTPDGTLFTGAVTLTGSKDVGSSVQVSPAGGGEPYCIDPPAGASTAGETWSCTFNAADGVQTVVVSQFLDDTSAAPVAPLQATVRVLGSPAIGSAALTTGLVSGTGYAGAGIRITAGDYDQTCTTVQAGGFWSCPLPLASGDYAMTVQQLWPGSGEAGGVVSQSITIDKEAPAVPVIAQPAAGTRITSQPFAYSGSGENGARVDVFVDAALACSATVASGVWSCTGVGVPDGDRVVQAIQWDAAGNPSAATTGITIGFGAAPTTPITPTDPQEPEPAQPAPQPAPAVPAPPSAPSTTPFPTPAFPLFPPPIGGRSLLPPFDTWGVPTDYGAAIPGVPDGIGGWLVGLLLAIAFIVLVAIPLRLLLGALRGRFEWRPRRIAGRNSRPDDDEPLLSPWVTAAGALGAAIILAALASGIQGEARFIRLMIAIGVALLIVNGVGVAIATKVSSRALGSLTGVRLVPLLLGAAAASALLSRAFGIQPPIIVGVVIAATFAIDASVRVRGLVALAQLGTMIALGVAAWLATTALGPVDGFWPSLASETLSALGISALGSALFLLLPVSGMPGQSLWEWSRAAWVGTALVGGAAASLAIAGGEHFPTGWLVAAAGIFAALSLAAWAWIRYVEPMFTEPVRS